jgi:hypothetical protein
MSPNVYLEFNDDDMLIATDGERTYKTWTYSDFEEYFGEAITPSMYDFMSEHVYDELDKSARWALEAEEYDGSFDEDAVNAYIELPWQKRLAMHERKRANHEAELEWCRKKVKACDEMPPFDPISPIYHEYTDFQTELKRKLELKIERLEREIHEEEQWRGGWEDGESQTDGPRYDESDEL